MAPAPASEAEEPSEEAPSGEPPEVSRGDAWLRTRVAEIKSARVEARKQEQREAQKRRDAEKKAEAERKAKAEAEAAEAAAEAALRARVHDGVRRILEDKKESAKHKNAGHFQGVARPVFVSYAPDAGAEERLFIYRFVRELKRRCGPDGAKVCFDWESGLGPWAGPAFLARRHELLAAAKVVLCVTSPAYFKSEACKLELEACRHRVVHNAMPPECLGDVFRATSCKVVQVPYRAAAEVQSEDVLAVCDALRLSTKRPAHESALEAAEEVQALLASTGAVCQYDVDAALESGMVWTEADVKTWVRAQSDSKANGSLRGNPLPIARWNRFDLQAWVESNGAAMMRHCATLYEVHAIDGFVLPYLTEAMARDLGVEAEGALAALLAFIQRRNQMDRHDVEEHDSLLQRLSDSELTAYLTEVFRGADKDDSGTLDNMEFKALLREANLGLTSKDINVIMEDVDLNNDGEISFNEFVPTMVLLLRGYEAKRAAHSADESVSTTLSEVAENLVCRGRSRAEIGNALREVFRAFDRDNSGALDKKEFHAALQQLSKTGTGQNPKGLTRREIRALMNAADFNKDGVIQYEEFVPTALVCLVEQLKTRMTLSQANHGIEWLKDVIGESFQARIAEKVAEAEYKARYDNSIRVSDARLFRKSDVKVALHTISEEVLGCVVAGGDGAVGGSEMGAHSRSATRPLPKTKAFGIPDLHPHDGMQA